MEETDFDSLMFDQHCKRELQTQIRRKRSLIRNTLVVIVLGENNGRKRHIYHYPLRT